MGDTIKQVGKYIRDTKRSADYNQNRYSENFPKIERVRDNIAEGSSGSFKMEFITARQGNKLLLSLNVYLAGEIQFGQFKVFIDGKDATTYIFGTALVSSPPSENVFGTRKILRNSDISALIKGAGIHTVEIISYAGSGNVEARVEIR